MLMLEIIYEKQKYIILIYFSRKKHLIECLTILLRQIAPELRSTSTKHQSWDPPYLDNNEP
jgi:hypothetical protein